MDNHLAAAWCWLQEISIDEQYNFLHIDQHYDLLKSERTVKNQIIEKGINLSSLSLHDYLNLNDGQLPIFRWDNYILNLLVVYPDLFDQVYFATKDNGENEGLDINSEIDIIDVPSFIIDKIIPRKVNNWIVNIDIDYVFRDLDGTYQYLTDEYILRICNGIHQALDNIEVVTICLSPECCGGWGKSYRIAKLMADFFGLDFKLSL